MVRGRPKTISNSEVAWNRIVDDIVATYCHKLNDDECYYKTECPFSAICLDDITNKYKTEKSYRTAMMDRYSRIA